MAPGGRDIPTTPCSCTDREEAAVCQSVSHRSIDQTCYKKSLNILWVDWQDEYHILYIRLEPVPYYLPFIYSAILNLYKQKEQCF